MSGSQTPRFRHRVEVPYFQVDQQRVVFNMWYLAWIDAAFSAYLDHLGFAYAEMVASGHDQQLVHLEIDWVMGVTFGDQVVVKVVPLRLGETSMHVRYTVERTRKSTTTRAASAQVVYVNIDPIGGLKRTWPEHLREVLLRVIEPDSARP